VTAKLSKRKALALLLHHRVTGSLGLFIGFVILLWLVALAQATQVSLAWDANTETDLAGYKLYYGTSSGSYPNSVALGKVTTYTVSGLAEGVTNYFALTAYNTKGLESGFSNVISYTPTTTPNTLTVTKAGTGSGTVTNSPPGTSFSAGTPVSLTAAPNTSSLFSGWSGACSGTANPCSMNMNANSTVTANFTLKTTKPGSAITSPINGATLRQMSFTITGSATDGAGSGIQKVEVSTDGGTTWKPTLGTIAWTYAWNIPGNGNYQIKSRATDQLGNVETPTAGISVLAASYQPTPVTVTGKQLLVNGSPFKVKGVVYSPVPIGEDPNLPPYGDYFTLPYRALSERDLPLLRALGANTLRLYHWENTVDHFDFLDRAFNGGVDPIYIIAGYWIDAGLNLDPNSTANVREQLKADFREMVAAHKTHPAILMWSVGHNVNQPGFSGNQLNQVFSLINEMALTAQLEEGASAHPVTTALADQDLAATIASFESTVPALDIWGANVYRGTSFGTLFSQLGPVTQKPLLIMEYGIDAFDQTRGAEYEKTGTPLQADYAEALSKEIAANTQTCLGGTIMSYSDEWWKARYTNDPGCVPDLDPGVQGRCGFSTGSQPDGYANEEWWGLVRIRDNGTGPDTVEPRAAYYRLQTLWKANSLVVTSPDGGESLRKGQSQTIRWSYAGQPGSKVQIELLRNGSLTQTLTNSFSLGLNGQGSYNWKPSSRLRTGSGYQVRITSTTNPAYTDLSNGNFSLR
jgi:hypothetical protein